MVARTRKAVRTRARLLEASRSVFERDGFHDARVADISKEAGVAHGTFYTYFVSKADIFRTLMAQVMEDVYDTHSRSDGNENLSWVQRIERGNQQFIEVYRKNSQMMGLMEQTGTYDDELRRIRLGFRQQAVARAQRSIVSMQREGLVPEDLNAACAAGALVSMVSNFVYFWLVIGEGDYDDEVALATLTRLWATALGLPYRS